MKPPRRLTALLLGLALGACTGSVSSSADVELSATQLRYRLLDRFTLFWCDPDYYPIARDDEQKLALERFPAIAQETEEFQAILEHLGLAGRAEFTDAEKLAIYREHKKLAAVTLLPLLPPGSGYDFRLRATEGNGVNEVSGSIDRFGRIAVRSRTLTVATCPICLDGETRISTPAGAVAVRTLRAGTIVWTLDPAGRRVAAPVLRTVRVATPPGHRLVDLRLSDGRRVLASPGHPTADGRRLADLAPGDTLAGARVLSAERVAAGPATYDLLPAGGTGAYWADGVLLGSTLAPPRRMLARTLSARRAPSS